MSTSVVTVCLNAVGTIAATIKSVLAQGDQLVDYVIVDGGSTDGTLDIVQAYAESSGGQLSWSSAPDHGIYDAMNFGLTRASGDFILFLGADDTLLEGALGFFDEAIAANPESDLVYGEALLVDASGRARLQRAQKVVRSIAGIPRTLPVCHQACAFSARALTALRGFDASYRIAGDYEFYLRFHEAGLLGSGVERPVVAFGRAGVSSRLGRATALEYRRARVAHGIPAWRADLELLRAYAGLVGTRILWPRPRDESPTGPGDPSATGSEG